MEKQTVIIVEDQDINRQILSVILKKEYNVLEAVNGKDAFEKMDAFGGTISAVLLDIIMPVMNGYEFLEALRDTSYRDVPVIAMTGDTDSNSELHMLEMGASDFVPKPYEPMVLMSRLRNAIARSQMHFYEQVKHIAEHDSLTDLYNRTKFYEQTAKNLRANPNTKFVFIRLDVNHFRVLNSIWGETECDKFLCYIACQITANVDYIKLCTYGRIYADIFCICMPYEPLDIKAKLSEIAAAVRQYSQTYNILPQFGVYIVDENQSEMETIYTRAFLAAKEGKAHPDAPISYFEHTLEKKLMRTHRIESEMHMALDDNQFIIYLQPKVNTMTNEACGAEALVRWKHPEKGIVGPDVFIPVFEHNGFITKLDYYVWDTVCYLLHKWKEEGKTLYPISVNMSRVSLYNPNVVTMLRGLIDHYEINPRLLNLEITESTFVENTDLMRETIVQLQEAGFLIMMDDFGSGYSSLNSLKDIPVDILKIDMRFLAGKYNVEKGHIILESVVQMAKKLSLSTVMEGVETKEQCDFVKSTGCEFIQGYYYARPMSVPDYVKQYKL